jgi:drug/metabolite transporter (DMT)-like permease
MSAGDRALPVLSLSFVGWSALAGITQIVGTWCLLRAFTLRNFAVGTLFAKTETPLVALLTFLILGELLGILSWIGIVVSTFGVLAIATRNMDFQDAARARASASQDWVLATVMGLGAGLLFAACAISVRAASRTLPADDFFGAALLTLATMTALQFGCMTAYAWVFAREMFRNIRSSISASSKVGILSILGSLGWFTAITLETPARVYGLGQIEMVFALLASRFYFHEKLSPRELAGATLIMLGIFILLAGRQ